MCNLHNQTICNILFGYSHTKGDNTEYLFGLVSFSLFGSHCYFWLGCHTFTFISFRGYKYRLLISEKSCRRTRCGSLVATECSTRKAITEANTFAFMVWNYVSEYSLFLNSFRFASYFLRFYELHDSVRHKIQYISSTNAVISKTLHTAPYLDHFIITKHNTNSRFFLLFSPN